jgi:hypothetical protein
MNKVSLSTPVQRVPTSTDSTKGLRVLPRRIKRDASSPVPFHGRSVHAVPSTFRIDADIFEAINDMAEKERTSVNAIVNRALRRYTEWEVFAEKFGLLSVTSGTITRLFNMMTDKQARELGANYGNTLAPELVTFWFKKFDFESILKALELLGSRYGRLFNFDYVLDGETYTLFIRHDRGMKHSIYYEEAAKALFGRLGIKPEISMTESQVTVNIPVRQIHRIKSA